MSNPLKPLDKLFDSNPVGNPTKPAALVYDLNLKKFVAAPPAVPKKVEGGPKPTVGKGSGEPRGKYRPKKKIGVGTIFGSLIVRRKLSPRKDVIPNLRIQFRCECTAINFEGKRCGRIIDVPRYYLLRKSNPKEDCGCTVQTLASKYKREKQIWNMMNFRTQDERHIAYEHYKKNGIVVCPEWHKDNPDGNGFERFFAHIGPCPSTAHSLDRIRNLEGYKPGNVVWATAKSQRLNQGDRVGGKTYEEIEQMGLSVDEWVEIVRQDRNY